MQSTRDTMSDVSGPGEPDGRLEPAPAPQYSVVIPFHDEAANAERLLEELRPVMVGLAAPYELVLVDDGSTDATAGVLLRVASDWPPCRVVRFARNQGQAAALYYGMRIARAPILITLDGDGQNVPADIPRLLARLADADLVAGVRVARQDSLVRRATSRLANAVRSRLLGDKVADAGCGLKILRREVAAEFIPIATLYSFMPALAVAAGFRVVEAPVAHRPRLEGASKYGLATFLWRPALDLLGVWWFSRRRVPALHRLGESSMPPSRGKLL